MSEIAVLGAGIMGHGIALVFALGGHAVRLTDSQAETLAKAPALMASALTTLREAGEVDGSWTAEKLGAAVRCCASLEETVRGAEVVIEAITELPDPRPPRQGRLHRHRARAERAREPHLRAARAARPVGGGRPARRRGPHRRVMAGKGFFEWGGRDPSELFRDRDRRLRALKKAMREIGPLTGD